MNVWLRRLILLVSIGGAFLGFGLAIGEVFQSRVSLSEAMLALCAAVLYGFGLFAGLMFVESGKVGIRLLAIFYAFQIPLLTSPVFSYRFFSGITAWIGFGGRGFSVHFGAFTAQFRFSLFDLDENVWAAGINPFAVLILWALVRLYNPSEANQSKDPAP